MELARVPAGARRLARRHVAVSSQPDHPGLGTLDQQMAQLSKVKRLAYDAGWMRWGWPERVGGLGGSSLLRGYLGEALVARDLVEPGIYSMTEVLAPTMIDYAAPDTGRRRWCPACSAATRPGARASPSRAPVATSARSPARRCAPTTAGVVNGQKVWTSLAQYAQRCVLLTRTGTPESAHRGITALFVDMDTPGITVRPLETMHGVAEFSEVFFDDVVVPVERTLGDEGQGWAVAMDLLPYERSTALWVRGAYLHRRLEQILAAVEPGALSPSEVGEAFHQVLALRARSRATQHRLHRGERLGPETSVDKILVAAAEQAVFDLAADGLARGDRPRRRPGRPALAGRVPVLPGRHDLRRQQRDPAQHRGPSPARPGT